MNTQTIKVKNMHCNACKSVIRMELEAEKQIDFGSKITKIDIVGENEGIVVLENVTDDEVVKAKQIINSIGEYQVYI